jgi:hypothetical protein
LVVPNERVGLDLNEIIRADQGVDDECIGGSALAEKPAVSARDLFPVLRLNDENPCPDHVVK